MPHTANGTVRVGVGGWTYEPWRKSFYPDDLPQRRELEYASRKLTSIEINGTYYGSQKPESFARWRDETPDDFVLSVKGPRFTTNRRVLGEAGESIARFFASGVMELNVKLGPVNWQFLPTKKFDAADFEAFLKLLPRKREGLPLRHVVEVRHPSFACPEFVALARAHEVAIVNAADSEFPQITEVTAPFVYARIMGTTEASPSGYPPAGIAAWADQARRWASGPEDGETTSSKPLKRDVFLYVISGYKAANPAAAMAILDHLAHAAAPAG